MQVSDYIVDFLKAKKVKNVFLVTGGAIAFVIDKIGASSDIEYICTQHEQSAAMAADAYSRIGPGIGVALATSGPGATNLITGICCSWFDSVPTLFITGQVNTMEQVGTKKVRQIGFQETNIVDIVRPITKFAAKLENASDIKYLLEKAVDIAKSDRQGPVLIDIPINLQYASLKKSSLKSYRKNEKNRSGEKALPAKKIKEVIKLISSAKRPVIVAGFGVRLAKADKELLSLVNTLGFPIVTTWSGIDLIAGSHPLLVGQFGIYGARSANFTVQNCDLLISIGARLDTRQTGKPSSYAKNAKKIIVDIDAAELHKGRGLEPDLEVNSDAKEFLTTLLLLKNKVKTKNIKPWLWQITKWKEQYPILDPKYYAQRKYVNPYLFMKVFSDLLPNNAIIVGDSGGNLTWTIQGIKIKKGQRLLSAFGNSPMGYALPAAIGAYYASDKKRPVICITGDGGLQINIQELQTIAHYKLPIKIIILNNKSYGIIKQFQDTWLGSRYEASEKGYSTPDFIKVAKSYGIKTIQIKNHRRLNKQIRSLMDAIGPVFCDVLLDPDQKIIPKLEYGSGLQIR